MLLENGADIDAVDTVSVDDMMRIDEIDEMTYDENR